MSIYLSVLLVGLSFAILLCSGITWMAIPDYKKSYDILGIGLLMFIIIWIFLVGNNVYNQPLWQQNYMATMQSLSISASLVEAYKQIAKKQFAGAAGSLTGTAINFFSLFVLASGGFFA